MRNWLKRYIHGKGLIVLIISVSVITLLGVFYQQLIFCVESVIKEYDRIILKTILICAGIGTAHAWLKRTKEDNSFFFKFLNNPFIAAVTTSVSYGVIMNACLALLYIVNYDKDLMGRYPSIDRLSVSATLTLLLVAAVIGQIKMIAEIIRPPQTTATTERGPNAPADEEKKSNDGA